MKLFIVPNGLRWGFRWDGTDEVLGSYGSPEEAGHVARHNFGDDVEIVYPKAKPATAPAFATTANSARADARLVSLISQSAS